MKRFYRDGEAAGVVESIDVSGLLMLLSRGSGGGAGDCGGEGIVGISARASSPDRVFECKTCNRQFSSFQALGGHRASHKKPRITGGGAGGEVGKPRAHECSICGLEFAIGQALGGHMRRHRAAAAAGEGFTVVRIEKKAVVAAAVGLEDDRDAATSLWLDLNVPPADGEVAECRRKKIFGFEIMDANPIGGGLLALTN